MKKQDISNLFKIFVEILPFLWVKDSKIRLCIVLSLFFTMLMIAFNFCTPLIFKYIVNTIINPKNNASAMIQIVLILYGSIWTVGQVVAQLRSTMMFPALERGMRLLSLRIFDHLHTLSLRFHLDRKTGSVMSTIERAQFGFEMVFWGLLLFILPTLIEMVLVITFITYFFGIFFSSVLLSIMIVYLVFSYYAISKSMKYHKIYNEKRSQSSARILDSLLNFETVKYFQNKEYDYEQCNQCLQSQEKAGVAKYFSETIVQLGQSVIIGIGFVYLTMTSGNAVIEGKMNIGNFILINGCLLQFVIPLNHIGYILHQIRNGFNHMKKALDLIELNPEIQDNPSFAINLKITKAEINFEKVFFGYEKKREILKGISFKVSVGKTVAIVGSTGSGKSTIIRLLFRFYDVTHGKILINGYDLRDISQKSLHRVIGVIPQDTVLFNNTLYYNIAYGCPSATKKDIEKAIKLSQLENFINNLPAGYDTVVGERGLKLSGGEKQRVAIARAILKQPKIFIFDEATSSLDVQTEQEVKRSIKKISTQSTTLIIAHRLSTIVHTDEILVLDKGLITECGNHQSLLNLNGMYATLWKQQEKNI